MPAMTKILVIEDEAGIRMTVSLMLKAEGFDVSVAENGRVGIEAARAKTPDLILCDINMPEMDGFGVLEQLRREPALAATPFVFLTANVDRTDMRRGMNLGADDYLTKPFTRDELLGAVTARIKKQETTREVLTNQLIAGSETLRQRFRSNIAGEEAPHASAEDELSAVEGIASEATVLFADIRGFTTISERLSAPEIAELLNAYLQRACEPIIACGGSVVKFIGDGIMAVFAHTESHPREKQALQAVHAGLGLSFIAHRFRDWVHERYQDRGLPEFAIGVGIHTGEVTLCRVGGRGQQDFTAIGDTVNIAARLEEQTKELGWPVVASEATISAAGAAVAHGANRSVTLRGRMNPITIYEVTGLKNLTVTSDRSTGGLSASMREALSANADGAANAAKAVLRETLQAMVAEPQVATPAAGAPLRIGNYRVIEKLGEGASSTVYLAERESDHEKAALKILNSRPGDDPDLLQRFVQEAALISRIGHPNIVRIFDHGFSEDFAYIAMEYFPAGSLKQVVAGPISSRQALSLLAQAASALAEIHRNGIVHRDVKPANFMVRENGVIALADFGVAKDLSSDITKTQSGISFGSPYYLSPEQAKGETTDHRSDLYSLGVIFYEMLTGNRPYESDSLHELIRQHVEAPPPKLPAELADCQELIDGLMAKDPAMRYQNAEAVLDAIDTVWTRAALSAARQPPHA
jgi:class 3 adenylate cyclase